MAVFGKIDSLALPVVNVVDPGDGTVDRVNLTGIGVPSSGSYVAPGDIIELGTPGVAYVIARTIDDDSAELSKPYAPGVSAGIAATRRTVPKEVAAYYHKNAEGAADSVVKEILGVSLAEAQTDGARSRGITGPGWWLYQTYTSGSSGITRHKAECIASFKVSRYGYQLGDTPIPAASAHVVGDDEFLTDTTTPEDTVASDVTSAITFGVDLADVTGVADPYTGSDITFTATSSDAAAITYQFQRRSAGSSRFVNVTNTLDSGVYGTTGSGTVASGVAAALTITGAAKADLDGAEYRVKLTSATGAPEVISATATLTYA